MGQNEGTELVDQEGSFQFLDYILLENRILAQFKKICIKKKRSYISVYLKPAPVVRTSNTVIKDGSRNLYLSLAEP